MVADITAIKDLPFYQFYLRLSNIFQNKAVTKSGLGLNFILEVSIYGTQANQNNW